MLSNFISFPSLFQYGIWVFMVSGASVTLWLWGKGGPEAIRYPLFPLISSAMTFEYLVTAGPAGSHGCHWLVVSPVIWSLAAWVVTGGLPWLTWLHATLADAKRLWLLFICWSIKTFSLRNRAPQTLSFLSIEYTSLAPLRKFISSATACHQIYLDKAVPESHRGQHRKCLPSRVSGVEWNIILMLFKYPTWPQCSLSYSLPLRLALRWW